MGFLGPAPQRTPPSSTTPSTTPVQTTTTTATTLERTLRGLTTSSSASAGRTSTPSGSRPPGADTSSAADKIKPASPAHNAPPSSESYENASLSALQKLTNSPLTASGSPLAAPGSSSSSVGKKLVEDSVQYTVSIQQLVNKVVDAKSLDEDDEDAGTPKLRGILEKMENTDRDKSDAVLKELNEAETTPGAKSGNQTESEKNGNGSHKSGDKGHEDGKAQKGTIDVKSKDELTFKDKDTSEFTKEAKERKSATPKSYLAYSQGIPGDNVAMAARKQYSIDEFDEFSDTEEEKDTSKSDSETVFTPPATPARGSGVVANPPTPPSIAQQQGTSQSVESGILKAVGSPRSPGRAISPKGSLLARATSPRSGVYSPGVTTSQSQKSPTPKCVQAETDGEPQVSTASADVTLHKVEDMSVAKNTKPSFGDDSSAKVQPISSQVEKTLVHSEAHSSTPQHRNDSIKPCADKNSSNKDHSLQNSNNGTKSPSYASKNESNTSSKDNDNVKSKSVDDKQSGENALQAKNDTKVPQKSNNNIQHHHSKKSSNNSNNSENTSCDNNDKLSTTTKTEHNSAIQSAGADDASKEGSDVAKPSASTDNAAEHSAGPDSTSTSTKKGARCNDIKSQVDGPSDFLDLSFTSSDSSDHEGISGVELTGSGNRSKFLEKFNAKATRSQKPLRSSSRIQEAKNASSKDTVQSNGVTVEGNKPDKKSGSSEQESLNETPEMLAAQTQDSSEHGESGTGATHGDDPDCCDNCDDCETDEEAEEDIMTKTFPPRCPWFSRLHKRPSYSAPTSPAAATTGTTCALATPPSISAHDDLVLTQQGSRHRKRKLGHLTPTSRSSCDGGRHGNRTVKSLLSSPRRSKKKLKGCQVNLEDIGKNPDFSRYIKSKPGAELE